MPRKTAFKEEDVPHKGYANYDTWYAANFITQDAHLQDLVKALWHDGYKSWGSMLCKLKEYGPTWRSLNSIESLDLRNDRIKSSEMTAFLKSLTQTK
jgi:hypothetical protein